MKRLTYISLLVLAVSCGKAAPVSDDNAWVNDESQRVPVLFGASKADVAQSKAIQSGLISGSVMKGLDVGVIGVAEKDVENPEAVVTWGKETEGTVLIDNRMVTTSATGTINFSPAVYYPYRNQYAYTFYSYYPYENAAGETASFADGAYSITYELGDTDILWAKSAATDYEKGGKVFSGFNAAYCRAVKQDGRESEFFPKLQYSHLLTALVFRVVGKESDIVNFKVRVNGIQLTDTYTSAKLCIADNQGEKSGVLTGIEKGNIGPADLDVKPTDKETDACTILAMPAGSYNAELTISNDNIKEKPISLTIGDGSTVYKAGYIYYFTVTVNTPEKVTIVETGLTEWKPGTNPTPGTEI